MPVDAVGLTQDLIRFNTIVPPGAEKACAQHIGRHLEGAGFHCDYVEMGEGRANLIARIGSRTDTLPLAFTGHIDVVPLGTRPWTMDPFAADIADGKVYGRGTSDMKSGVAAFVAAAIDLAPMLAASAGLVLIITAGEETGCTGARHIVASARDLLGTAGALVVAEPTSNRPLVGHKGALRLLVTARGVTAHASMPDQGINAVSKAARAVHRLDEFDFNVARHPVMGAPTLNVGWMHGGININSVPDLAEVGLDIRTLPSQSHTTLTQQLASYLGSDVEVSTLDEAGALWTDPSDCWLASVFAAVDKVTAGKSKVEAAPYFTDASVLTPAYGGVPTVVLGPGPAHMAHQTDEFCEVLRIEQAKAIYLDLIRAWSGL